MQVLIRHMLIRLWVKIKLAKVLLKNTNLIDLALSLGILYILALFRVMNDVRTNIGPKQVDYR